MADSFVGVKRTDYCGTLRREDAGREVTLCGWVSTVRKLGALTFIKLRDRSGEIQLSFDESKNKALHDQAAVLRGEYVVAVSGKVAVREAINPDMPTGEVEVWVENIKLLSEAETPPFEIVEDCNTNETTRLKYRYLDLRRPDLQRNIMLRHRVGKIARDFYDSEGFLEIETPMLIRSTPEGARDYIVPSRVRPGSFYALPQSPQLYKQLLMLAGYDRYVQIARCFRDEDLRADRQPEFTQIDLEMSFVNEDDVMGVNERFIQKVFKEAIGVDVALPLRRMTWREAMDRFGSDKPDLRFGFELKDLSEIAKTCGFKVFSGAVEAGGSVRAINISGYADKFPRREIDSLTEFAKTYRAKGVAFYKSMNGEVSSSFAKFMTEDEMNAIKAAVDFKDGDLLLMVADADERVVFDSLGALRCEIADRLGLTNKDQYEFLWVTEFPQFEYDDESGRYKAMHHPFTAPMDEDVQYLESDPGKVRAKAYDIVLNGVELGGGSLRIYDRDLQNRMFKALGFTEEAAQEQFGFLLDAFKYGVPPHGGMAYGFDRLLMLMTGADSIRDVMAFPKVQNASELMTDCPSPVNPKQLEELRLDLNIEE